MSGIGQTQQISPQNEMRMRLIQSMMQSTQNPNTTFGGLANAGSAIARAMALRGIQTNPNQGVQMPAPNPPQATMFTPQSGMPPQ